MPIPLQKQNSISNFGNKNKNKPKKANNKCKK